MINCLISCVSRCPTLLGVAVIYEYFVSVELVYECL
jgi:hypothetical protein